ncbi:type 2 periplasmic-binding domain-containing protein [Sinorhizobium chiapasense]|uniref:Uncharacterized protein n=1 Tax=Sinorhizobium chiapasense TaxID=501572 RepID=A0ABZ2BKS1_9HYPH
MTYDRGSFLNLVGNASTGLVLATGVTAIAASRHRPGKDPAEGLDEPPARRELEPTMDMASDKLKKRTDSQLDMQVSKLRELGHSGSEIIRSLRSSIVDFADVAVGYGIRDIPAIEAIQLPGVYTDNEQIRRQ